MATATLALGLRPIIVAGLFAVTYLVAILVYRLFFAPLSKLPGPKLTAVTQLWLMYHEFKGDRTVQIDRLHCSYGPVVRVSPDEISFNNYDALRDIYGIKSTFSKSSFYDLFVYYNERNTFTSLDKPNVCSLVLIYDQLWSVYSSFISSTRRKRGWSQIDTPKAMSCSLLWPVRYASMLRHS